MTVGSNPLFLIAVYVPTSSFSWTIQPSTADSLTGPKTLLYGMITRSFSLVTTKPESTSLKSTKISLSIGEQSTTWLRPSNSRSRTPLYGTNTHTVAMVTTQPTSTSENPTKISLSVLEQSATWLRPSNTKSTTSPYGTTTHNVAMVTTKPTATLITPKKISVSIGEQPTAWLRPTTPTETSVLEAVIIRIRPNKTVNFISVPQR